MPNVVAAKIRAITTERGISRLCHFTLAKTFFKIAAGRVGILSAKKVNEDFGDTFYPTDEQRFDGYSDHVCCSIQFPNAYYLKKAQDKEPVFKDWVVLMINPRYLWSEGTKFCPVNAAKGKGIYVTDGVAGFEGLFSNSVIGSTFARSAKHRADCPTDMQAEILVPDRIDLQDIIGVAFPSGNAAQEERGRLRMGGVTAALPPFMVCPDFFNAVKLRNIVRDRATSVELEVE